MNDDFKEWEKPPKIESQKIITTCVTVPVAIANERSKMSDLIKRSDAIKALCDAVDNKGNGEWLYTDEFCNAINSIPSADRPKKVVAQITFDEEKLREIVKEAVERFKEEYEITDRPQGEWIWSPRDTDGTVSGCCSNCSFSHLFIGGHTAQYNYCPSCGARMFAKDINVPNKEGADDE